jgi:hypothetical protein
MADQHDYLGSGAADHSWKKSTMARASSPTTSMVGQIGTAVAKADNTESDNEPSRFRRLALAALKPMARPAEPMVDAAHEGVSFDDFRKAVRAMILGGDERLDCGLFISARPDFGIRRVSRGTYQRCCTWRQVGIQMDRSARQGRLHILYP